MTKKFVSMFLALVMCLSLAAPAFAAEEESPANEFVLVKVESYDLTEEEAVELLMEKKGYTREEAEAKIYDSQRVTPLSFPGGKVSQHTEIRTYDCAGYSVEIGGLFDYWTNGQYQQINGLREMWTAAVGGGNYTWNQFYLSDVTASYPNHTAKLMSRGCIEVAVDVSVSGGADFKLKLINAGFSVGATVGSTQYLRYTLDMELIYTVYSIH